MNIKSTIRNSQNKWIDALKNKTFFVGLIVTFAIFLCQMLYISFFQTNIELRSGFAFDDPITKNLPILNLEWLTFFALYSAHLIAIIIALQNPNKFFQLLLGYFFVYFFRIFSLYLLPLDPPIGIIPLKDPFLMWFANGAVINKDLFYSGHTATTFMVLLVTGNKKAKIFILIDLIFVVCGVLLQRVHYSIDVYAAFFFAFAAFRLSKYTINKLFIDENSTKK